MKFFLFALLILGCLSSYASECFIEVTTPRGIEFVHPSNEELIKTGNSNGSIHEQSRLRIKTEKSAQIQILGDYYYKTYRVHKASFLYSDASGCEKLADLFEHKNRNSKIVWLLVSAGSLNWFE